MWYCWKTIAEWNIRAENIFEKNTINLLMHNVEKWPDLLLKSCSVNTARFLKYI